MEPFTDYSLIDGISDENINNGIDFRKKVFCVFSSLCDHVTEIRRGEGIK